MVGGDRGTTTVAFELAALERVADPAWVFEQTAGWARSVGIVSDRQTPVLTKRARDWGIDYGFTSGPRDLLDSLVTVSEQPEHDADRYLLIATDEISAEAVEERGWAFLDLTEAADAAGWELISNEESAKDPESRGWP